MKKTFMRTLAIELTFCFTFAFSVSAALTTVPLAIVTASNKLKIRILNEFRFLCQ